MSEPFADGKMVPSVNEAKRVATAFDLDGVIVVFVRGEQFGTASYGRTRAECARLARASDAIVKMVQRGDLAIADAEDQGKLF